MRVLITRPEDDATRIAARLEDLGHEPVLMPLLTLRLLDGPEVVLDGVQAILATSANGVHALARRTQRRDVPLFAVGPQTDAAARTAGFQSVRNAKGDAEALARATAEWAKRDGGVLLHVKGAEGGSALAEHLNADGFKVRSTVLYDIAAPDAPPAAFAPALAGAGAALFFSPRSARVFKECAHGLATDHLIAVCISAAAASALKPLAFREIRIAAQPNQQAILACLD